MSAAPTLISIVIPTFNEAEGIEQFHRSLVEALSALSKTYQFEIIYCDDGSCDETVSLLHEIAKRQKLVRVVALSRNFGKEVALSAGIAAGKGAALITLDADGQHPVELIPQFLNTWREGVKIVVGQRAANQGEGLIKKYGSALFYFLFNRVIGADLVPRVTDYCLIDAVVQKQFVQLSEQSRMTRALINWLGFEKRYITFTAHERLAGHASYSLKKLFTLALDSVISMSASPLYLAAYAGALIVPAASVLGIGMVIETLLGDPLKMNITGTAYLAVLLLLFVGVLLLSQGVIGIYLSRIYQEVKKRPLYVIDESKSVRL